MLKFMLITTSAFLVASTVIASESQMHKMEVKMTTASGADAGIVTVVSATNGVVLQAALKNLTPGGHGFHIHEAGSCADGFKAAGGHFNPDGVSHGINHGEAKHAGDLPNLHVSSDGIVNADAFAAVTFEGDRALMDANGSAIIIHEKADTYNEKAGAGGRIACGVIYPGK